MKTLLIAGLLLFSASCVCMPPGSPVAFGICTPGMTCTRDNPEGPKPEQEEPQEEPRVPVEAK